MQLLIGSEVRDLNAPRLKFYITPSGTNLMLIEYIHPADWNQIFLLSLTQLPRNSHATTLRCPGTYSES